MRERERERETYFYIDLHSAVKFWILFRTVHGRFVGIDNFVQNNLNNKKKHIFQDLQNQCGMIMMIIIKEKYTPPNSIP